MPKSTLRRRNRHARHERASETRVVQGILDPTSKPAAMKRRCAMRPSLTNIEG